MNAHHANRRSKSSVGVLVLFLAAPLVAATSAWARTESVRWTHSAPQDVVRFVLQIGDAQGTYSETLDLGKPSPNSSGVYSSTFDVADTRGVYVALVAVGTSLSSNTSNEQFRPGSDPGTGGTGTTPVAIESPGTANAATAGALARFDFGSGTTGWADTGANFSIIADDSQFAAASVGGNSALTTQSSSSDIHSHFADSSSDYSNMRLRGRMALDRASAGMGVTAYSLYKQFNRYYGLTALPGQAFKISANPYGGLSCTTDSTGVVPQPGKWYEFDFAVEPLSGSSRITATVWLRGTPKPGSPQVTCTDSASTRPGSGKIGVWATGSGQKAWDDLEVIAVGTTGGGSQGTVVAPPVLISIQPVAP